MSRGRKRERQQLRQSLTFIVMDDSLCGSFQMRLGGEKVRRGSASAEPYLRYVSRKLNELIFKGAPNVPVEMEMGRKGKKSKHALVLCGHHTGM